MTQKRCLHSWELLYQIPTDSDFLKVYNTKELDAYKKCKKCGAIGKRSESGSILQLPKAKWDWHKGECDRWAKNLKTFEEVSSEAKA